jgi:uncharacterized membrane protein
MNITNSISYYLLLLTIIFIIDIIAITLYFKNQYMNILQNIQSSKFQIRLLPAIFFYLLFTLGIYIFVIPHIRENYIFRDSLIYGGLFGLILYGFYGLTVYTFIEKWKLSVVIMDFIWGGILCFIGTYLSLKIYKMI